MAEIGAYIGYDDEGKPALILCRTIEPDSRKAYIKLNDAWLFSEDHNEAFEEHIANVTAAAYDYLGLGTLHTSKKIQAQRMAEIAGQVEKGIDQLLKTAPRPQEQKEIGEFQAEINGQNIEGVLHA